MLFGCLGILFNIFFSKNSYNTIRVPNRLDSDQAQHCVGPDLGPNFLQKLLASDTDMIRVNYSVMGESSKFPKS